MEGTSENSKKATVEFEGSAMSKQWIKQARKANNHRQCKKARIGLERERERESLDDGPH